MEALVLLIGLGCGALVCWLILNKRNSRNLVRMHGSQEAISKLASQLDARTSELRQKAERENQLNSELSELQNRLDIVTREQDLLNDQVSELEGFMAGIAQERSEVDSLIAELQFQLESAHQAQSQLPEVAELKYQLEILAQERSQLNAQMLEMQAELENVLNFTLCCRKLKVSWKLLVKADCRYSTSCRKFKLSSIAQFKSASNFSLKFCGWKINWRVQSQNEKCLTLNCKPLANNQINLNLNY
jgi:uncharacterized phage infection (PIP) family protein YhgE